MTPITLNKAILVTWEWAGTYAMRKDKTAAILSADLDPSTVKLIVESLHKHNYVGPTTMASCIADPNSAPCRYLEATFSTSGSNDYVRMTCGESEATLLARMVRNLSVEFSDDDSTEIVTWEEQTADKEWVQGSYKQPSDAAIGYRNDR
jgi:hypothetical protein